MQSRLDIKADGAGGPLSALVTGGTGYAGRFIVEALLSAGHDVTVAGRSPPPETLFSRPTIFRPFDLDQPSGLAGLFEAQNVLVHAAFDHLPGRYRGGEGDDPAGFRRRNLDGTVALFAAAREAGVRRAVFLSSRAVYGPRPPGQTLRETDRCEPDTLYGEVKLAAETAMAAMASDSFRCVSLRATGIYGAAPGGLHKWSEMFARFHAGEAIAPRAATEVHGRDLAAAILLLLGMQSLPPYSICNVSDLLLDTRDILALTGWIRSLPQTADKASVNVLACDRLAALGWMPGGWKLLAEDARKLALKTEAGSVRNL